MKEGEKSLLESLISHIVTLMTLSLSIIKGLKSLLLIFTTSVASYLDLLFTRDQNNKIATKLSDKRGAFGFHIVNFPFMSRNIPLAPVYSTCASQLIRYTRCCSHLGALVTRLLLQGYKVSRLSNAFKKIYDKHTDLVGQYKKNVCQMFAYSTS